MLFQLVNRNLKLYFRDKTAVFFSLFAVIIVIILSVLFLSKFQLEAILNEVGNSIPEKDILYLINSQLLAGLLSISSFTNVLGGYGAMISDREKKLVKRYKSAPMKSWIYPFANILSSFFIGVIVSIIIFIIYSTFIYFNIGYFFTINQILKCIGFIIVASMFNSMLIGFICSFLSRTSAFSAISILFGSVIGFINGLYIPIGTLGATLKNILNIFPTLHIASIFRKILTNEAINLVFNNAPEVALNNYKNNYGLILQFNEREISTIISILFIALVGIVSFIFMTFNLKRKQEEI